MVNKITINPKEVRGAGDIVSPKSLTDFGAYNSKLTSSSESVDGELMTVYTESYLTGSYFTITAQRFVPIGSGSVTVDVVLRSISDDSVIGDAWVSCFVNDELFTTGTTDSNGSVSFSVVLNDYTSFYRIRLKFDGSDLVAGCFGGVGVVQGDLSSISLLGLSDVVVSGEDVGLLASVRAVDVDGGSIGVPFQPVEFLQFNPLLFYFEGRGGFEVDNWQYNHSALTVTSDDTGTTVANSSGTRKIYWANINPTSTSDSEYDSFNDITVDFDLISCTGGYFILRTSDGGTTGAYNKTLTNVTGHIQFKMVNGVMEYYLDGVLVDSASVDDSSYQVAFYVYDNSTLKFKNLIIGGY